MKNRPNILFVLTDQLSACALGCMGNPDIETNAIDSLASSGTLFETSYCTQPICTPSRGSMFTGLMPHECGTTTNNLSIHEHLREQELGNILARSGYECIYGGYWGVPEGAMPEGNDHGFRPICGGNDNLLAEACGEVLKERAASAAGRANPFFLVVSFFNPHNVCEYARNMQLPLGPIGDPPSLDECPNLPHNFLIPPFEPEIIRVVQQHNWSAYPYRDSSPEDWRRLRWGYYRIIEKVDREIGKILSDIREYGLDEDTLVVLSSDHGEGHGAHRWNQKSILYEEVVRVPLIVRAPRGRAGHVDRTHLVSTGLDIVPTLCDYAGIEPPANLRGKSLRPLVEGRAQEAWRDAVFVETVLDSYGGGRAVRTDRYKYIVYDRGRYPEQLFDMNADPGEMVNLAVESRHSGVLHGHRTLLREHLHLTKDNFRFPGHICIHGS